MSLTKAWWHARFIACWGLVLGQVVACGTNSDAGGGSGGSSASGGTPGAVIGTPWNTPDIWLRRRFDAGNVTAAQLRDLMLRLHHDENVEVYVNGVSAASLTGYDQGYSYTSMAQSAQQAIIPSGANVLAAHCQNTVGGQFVDVGVYLSGI